MSEPEIPPDVVLAETLALLREVADYLRRLPLVPVTADFVIKIDAHLSDPTTVAAQKVATRLELERQTRHAGDYTRLGLPKLELTVSAERVKIQVTQDKKLQAAVFAKLRSEDGLDLPLVHVVKRPGRQVD